MQDVSRLLMIRKKELFINAQPADNLIFMWWVTLLLLAC
jgi:hypothetical protein